MPINFETSQIIEKPIQKVFSFLGDFSNMTEWNYYIQTVTKKSEGETGVGTIYEMKRPHDLNAYRIIVFDPPHKIIVELQPPGPKHQLIFELRSLNENETNIRYKWQLDAENYGLLKYFPGGIFKRLILSVPKRIILKKTKPAVEQNFKKLKELLESGQTILQNGRHVVLMNK
jgi:uncharacterized protein YndB with AHSA1/START domain